jgi:ribonuclease HIII
LTIQNSNKPQELFDNLISKTKNDKQVSFVSPNESHIGADESGTGDFFGGISCCAVYLDKKNIDKLNKLGVKDSKLLTDEKMKSIYEQLISLVDYELFYISPEKYNIMHNKYKNINVIKAIMHNDILSKISNRHKYTPIILDQFVNENKYYSYLKENNISIKQIDLMITKAESKYMAVACASIISRIKFVTELELISKNEKLNLPLGSSNPKIVAIAKQLKESKSLSKMAKIDFKILK